MLKLGKRSKIGLEIPSIMLTESVPGKMYALHIKVSGQATDEIELAKSLITGLYSKFKAKITYMAILSDHIEIQLEGSPFAWTAVAVYLPSILTVFGLVMIGIAIFTVFASIPSWAWGLLLVGTVIIVATPSVAKWL